MDNTCIYNNAMAAAFLNIKPSTLAKWRCMHRGPRYSKIGKRVVYELKDLMEYIENNKVNTLETLDTVSSRGGK